MASGKYNFKKGTRGLEWLANFQILSLSNSYEQKNTKVPKTPLRLGNSLQIFVSLGFYRVYWAQENTISKRASGVQNG